MLEKIKSLARHSYFQQFRDVRALGLAGFGIIVLLVSWSGIKAIQTNYELQKKISALQQKNDVSQLENNNLKLKNEYLQTDQFLELAARRQFGKAAPGETIWLVPKSVALAHTVDAESAKQASKKASTQSKSQQNFQAWMDFFFHRHK